MLSRSYRKKLTDTGITDGVAEDEHWSAFSYGAFSAGRPPSEAQQQFTKSLAAAAPPQVDPLWVALTDDEVRLSISTLTPYIQADRMQRFRTVLSQRSARVRFVFENPANANNVWAALRTFDAVGLQYADIILDPAAFIDKDNLRRKSMGAALGCQKYMSVAEHADTRACLLGLKAQGYTIAVADLHHPATMPVSSLAAFTSATTKTKTAILLGNEKLGASTVARELADVHFFLPMRGFAESLNVSAFCAMLLGQFDVAGGLKAEPGCGAIAGTEADRILLTWMARTAPGALQLLRRAGLSSAGNRLWDTVSGCTNKT
jgi:tRNA G18 (ribose-2'-O)-methylase SpoU